LGGSLSRSECFEDERDRGRENIQNTGRRREQQEGAENGVVNVIT